MRGSSGQGSTRSDVSFLDAGPEPDACLRWQASLTHICITNAFRSCDATVTSRKLLLPLILVSDLIDHVGGVLESFVEFV